MRYSNAQLLPATSMAATLHSFGELIEGLAVYSIQAVFTGSPVGSLILQGSNDMVPISQVQGTDPAANVVNWSTIANTTTAVSTAGSQLWNMPSEGYRWVRVLYTFTSGTGSISAQFSGKGI